MAKTPAKDDKDEVTFKTVEATAKGYYEQIRQPGDQFEVPDTDGFKKSSWFVDVKTAA